MKTYFLAIERRLTALIIVIACLLLGIASTLGMYQVLTRFIFGQPSTWSEIAIRLVIIWMVMFGVVVAFREGAQAMQTAAEQVQKLINPLMLHFMETLRDVQQIESLRSIHSIANEQCPALAERMRRHAEMQDRHAAGSRRAGLALNSALDRFQSVIAELDYVVVNGRIEAALKGAVNAPLAQVSLEMDRSVSGVQELLRAYREQIERIVE